VQLFMNSEGANVSGVVRIGFDICPFLKYNIASGLSTSLFWNVNKFIKYRENGKLLGECIMDLIDTEVQGEAGLLGDLKRKDHFTGKIVKITLAGAIVDIGLGIPGVVHISQLQAEPVNRVEDVVQIGQEVEVWVKRVFPRKDRIELTMVKPLELEWREIEPDMVLKGKVIRLEKYGAFIDIGAERAGLVHISEMSHSYVKGPEEVVKEGDEVEVKVIQVSRKKKQIKLSMKALIEPPAPVEKQAPAGRKQGGKRGAGQGETEVAGSDVHSGSTHETSADATEVEEHIPTAMEIALRKAMERSKEDEPDVKAASGKKDKKVSMDDVLARTLESRPTH